VSTSASSRPSQDRRPESKPADLPRRIRVEIRRSVSNDLSRMAFVTQMLTAEVVHVTLD
jgi:hypothetical protein